MRVYLGTEAASQPYDTRTPHARYRHRPSIVVRSKEKQQCHRFPQLVLPPLPCVAVA